jgi:hypothetical protein
MRVEAFPNPEPERDCLAACRRRLDRLHREAAVELGPEPMVPEKFSMLAMMLVSVPLSMLVHLDPGHRLALETGVALLVVWLAALQFQRIRCDRFEARCDRAVQRAIAEPEPPAGPRYLIFR